MELFDTSPIFVFFPSLENVCQELKFHYNNQMREGER
jgi:hypothetical protein